MGEKRRKGGRGEEGWRGGGGNGGGEGLFSMFVEGAKLLNVNSTPELIFGKMHYE